MALAPAPSIATLLVTVWLAAVVLISRIVTVVLLAVVSAMRLARFPAVNAAGAERSSSVSILKQIGAGRLFFALARRKRLHMGVTPGCQSRWETRVPTVLKPQTQSSEYSDEFPLSNKSQVCRKINSSL